MFSKWTDGDKLRAMFVSHIVFVFACYWVITTFCTNDGPLPPEALRINGLVWQVKYVDTLDAADGSEGFTECHLRTIGILKNQTRFEMQDTLIHEILHAMTCTGGLVHNEFYQSSSMPDGQVINHEGIYFAAPHLADFMRENPAALAFLQHKF